MAGPDGVGRDDERSAREATVDALARGWADALARWAIPEEILRSAPESPWGFPTEVFERVARDSLARTEETPSCQRAREALGSGGTVLDVGAGAGAASLALVPPAGFVTAVDESEGMLEAFSDLAGRRGVAHATVAGRWPDVAGRVAAADVVVCHHVAYNVADIVPFVRELDGHARRRVVLEVTRSHPMSDLNSAWAAIHHLERPDKPVAEDLVRLVSAMGIEVHAEAFEAPPRTGEHSHRVAMARRRLCVGPERDDEIARLLPTGGRSMVTIWWDGKG